VKHAMILGFVLSFFAPVVGAQCTRIVNPGTPDKLNCALALGPVTGGSGSDWGKWYEITSLAIPDGYSIVSVSFRLEGPHPCSADLTYPTPPPTVAPATATPVKPESKQKANPQAPEGRIDQVARILGSVSLPDILAAVPQGAGSWAQCEQIKQSKSSVTWRFRFQGWTSENRSVSVGKNSDTDASCKQKDKSPEKQQYCDQTSVHVGWTNKNEAIRQRATLLTIAMQ
jgi:hypothetical protein